MEWMKAKVGVYQYTLRKHTEGSRQRPLSFEGENGRDAPVSRASVPAWVLLQVVLVVVLSAEPLLELVDLGDDLLAFRVKVLLLNLLLDLLGDVALLGRRVEDG